MAVIDKLASSLGRRDEAPNLKLAEELTEKSDKRVIAELVKNLSNKELDIQSDCIKVLYEIGERKPALISGYAEEFLSLLDNKNNRLSWGAMTALDCITLERPKAVRDMLPKILEVANKGSVITRDRAVGILVKLASDGEHGDYVMPLLVEQLGRAPSNQLPMYAENALPVIRKVDRDSFLQALRSRLGDIEKESKRRRVEKVMMKLSRSES